jgi:hypothetical protein
MVGNGLLKRELQQVWLAGTKGARRRVLEAMFAVYFKRATIREERWFADPEGGPPSPAQLKEPTIAAIGELSEWEAGVQIPIQEIRAKVTEWVRNPTLRYPWGSSQLEVERTLQKPDLQRYLRVDAETCSLTSEGRDYVRAKFSSAPLVAKENPKWKLKPTLRLPSASQLKEPTMAALGELSNWSPGIPVRMGQVQLLVRKMVLDPKAEYSWSIDGKDGNYYSCLYRQIALAYRSLRYVAWKGDKEVPLANSPMNGWWSLTGEGAEEARQQFSRSPQDKVTKLSIAKRAGCSQQIAGKIIIEEIARARLLFKKMLESPNRTPSGERICRWSDLADLSELGYGEGPAKTWSPNG